MANFMRFNFSTWQWENSTAGRAGPFSQVGKGVLGGTLAARPAAGIADRVYVAFDNGKVYFDDGAAWQDALVSADADTLQGLTPTEIQDDLLEGGTAAVFYQASAPTGWTQNTGVNDRMLRVVSGSGGGSGGNWTISGLNVAGHTLTESEMPAHNHVANEAVTGSHNHRLAGSASGGQYGGGSVSGAAVQYTTVNDATSQGWVDVVNTQQLVEDAGDHSHNVTIDNAGGGNSHSHGISHNGGWRPAYINMIVCTRD